MSSTATNSSAPFQHSDRVWLATKDGQRWTLKFAPLEARDNEAVLHHFVKETWNATRLHAEYFRRGLRPGERDRALLRHGIRRGAEPRSAARLAPAGGG